MVSPLIRNVEITENLILIFQEMGRATQSLNKKRWDYGEFNIDFSRNGKGHAEIASPLAPLPARDAADSSTFLYTADFWHFSLRKETNE